MISLSIHRYFAYCEQQDWYAVCQFWCMDRFGPEGTTWSTSIDEWNITFLFENDTDATMFALRWVK